MKLKELNNEEQFIFAGWLWKASLLDGKAKFTPISKHDKKRKEVIIPSEEEIKKYAKDNGYDPDFMWEKAKGYIDAGMRDSQDNPVKNLKLKLNQVWFQDKYKIKETKPQQTIMVR